MFRNLLSRLLLKNMAENNPSGIHFCRQVRENIHAGTLQPIRSRRMQCENLEDRLLLAVTATDNGMIHPVFSETDLWAPATAPRLTEAVDLSSAQADGADVSVKTLSEYSSPTDAGMDAHIYSVENVPESTEAVSTNYAVLFSGGKGIYGGTSWYNDRCFYDEIVGMYNVLVKSGISRENIYVLYADGLDSGADQNIIAYEKGVAGLKFINSDMSFALSSRVYSATRENFNSVMNSVGSAMGNYDHLFFFASGHGYGSLGAPGETGEEGLNGWNNNNISAEEFANGMFKVTNGYVTVAFSTCFGGGILDNIIDPATGACRNTSLSSKWYGFSSTNHYEMNYYYYLSTPSTYEIVSGSVSNFGISLINAIDNLGKTAQTRDTFAYAKRYDPFLAEGTYSNNQGGYVSEKEHPWGAGADFSLFADGSVPDSLSPPAISRLTQDATSVTVVWGAVTHANRYTVEYSTDASFSTCQSETTANLSFKVQNLTLGTTYYFRVRATDTTGAYSDSNNSNVRSITVSKPDPVPLSKPVISSINAGTVNATVVWGAVTGANYYTVEYSTNSNFSNCLTKNVYATSATVNNLTPDTTYYFRVRAGDSTGAYLESANSAVRTVTMEHDPTIPIITSLTTQNATATLTWEAVTGARDYIMFYSTDSDFVTYNARVTTGLSYTTDKLTTGDVYYFRVLSRDSANVRSGVSDTRSILIPASGMDQLSTPIISGLTAEGTSVTVIWGVVPGASRYVVDYSTNSAFTNCQSVSTSNVSLTVKNLTVKMQYYFRVHAEDLTEVYTFSENSGTETIYVDLVHLATPVISGLSASGTTVTVAWNTVANANLYGVDYSADSTFGSFTSKTIIGLKMSITKMTQGETYYFRVKAMDTKGNYSDSDYSAIRNVTIDKTPLAAPVINSLTTDGSTANFAWNAVVSADRYAVEYSTSSTFATCQTVTTSDLSMTVTDLMWNTEYYFRVRAVDSTGFYLDSSYSETRAVKTDVDPRIPIILRLIADGTSVTVTWKEVTGAQDYIVYYSEDSDFANKHFNVTTEPLLTVENLTPGRTWYFRMQSRDASNMRSDYSETKEVALDPITLVTPVISDIDVGTTAAIINWNAVDHANSYTVEYSLSSDFANAISETSTGLTASVKNLTPGATYYFRVQAFDTTGIYQNSAWSMVRSETMNRIPLTAPIISGLAVDGTSVTVSWGAVTNAASYMLEYADDATFTENLSVSTNTLSATVKNLTPGTVCYFRVRAVASNGIYSDSTYSAINEMLIPDNVPVIAGLTANGTSVVVTWNAVSGAKDYIVSYSADPNFDNYKVKVTSDLSLTVEDLTPEIMYYFRVLSRDANYVRSGYSTVRSITIDPIMTKVEVNVLFSTEAPTVSTVAELPESITIATDKQTVYAQIWMKNIDGSNNGITGGYLDLSYSSSLLKLDTIYPGACYSDLSECYTMPVDGQVATFGGMAGMGQLSYGVSSWVLLGYVSFTVMNPGTASFSTSTPTVDGSVTEGFNITRANDSYLPSSAIVYGSVDLEINHMPPLPVPTGLTVVSAGANRVLVNWDTVSNASGYRLVYSTDQMVWTEIGTTEKSYMLTGLTYGSAVYYKVKAVGGDTFSDSIFSDTVMKYVCPMDVDGNGTVGPSDRTRVSSAWMSRSTSAKWDLCANIDGDVIIGPGDLTFLSQNWMKRSSSTNLVFPQARAELVRDNFLSNALFEEGDLADEAFEEDLEFLGGRLTLDSGLFDLF